MLLSAAQARRAPSGTLALDAANPVISVAIEGVPLRLRVDLNQQNSVELNPAAAVRLPVKWEKDEPTDVGRVRLDSRVARAAMRVDGRVVQTQVSEHGRDCCADSDGAIGPDLLPYATVRWRNALAPPPAASLSFPLVVSPDDGLSAPAGVANVRLRFALGQARSVGTAAAGATLSRLWDGRWDGPPERVILIFGVTRPARIIAFAGPSRLAGFRFDRLLVRISDFAGDEKLPADPARGDEIVVSHRLSRQQARPVVLIGADRLSRCTEVVYQALPRSLTLHCAFDAP